MARHCAWLLEQPHGSLLPAHFRWQWLCNRIARATQKQQRQQLKEPAPYLKSFLLPGLHAGSMDGPPRRGLLKADSFDVFYANNFAVGSWCVDEERERKEDNSEDCSKLDCKMFD